MTDFNWKDIGTHQTAIVCPLCKINNFTVGQTEDNHKLILKCSLCRLLYVGNGEFIRLFVKNDKNKYMVWWNYILNGCLYIIYEHDYKAEPSKHLPLIPLDITLEKLEQLLLLA
jgi:hypothetical protein